MKNTTHYNLKKPDRTDVIKIDDLNYNVDVIDGELNKRALKTDIPSELPADGGNADTIGGKSPSDFATIQQGMKADTALQSDKLGKSGGAAKHDQLISDYYKKNEVDGKISAEVNRVDAQMAEIMSQQFDTKTYKESFNKLENCEGGSLAVEKIKGRTLAPLVILNNATDWWGWFSSTLIEDSTDMFMGLPSIKSTIANGGCAVGAYQNIKNYITVGKSYFSSIYVKKSNLDFTVQLRVRIIYNDGTTEDWNYSETHSLTDNFYRLGVKFKATKTVQDIYIYVQNSSTAVADMSFKLVAYSLYEIPIEDYILSEQELLEKYPYVSDIQGSLIRNIKTLGKNLFNKNSNYKQYNNTSLDITSTGFILKTTSKNIGAGIIDMQIKVRKNTQYSLSSTSIFISGQEDSYTGRIEISDYPIKKIIGYIPKENNHTYFNSGNNSIINIRFLTRGNNSNLNKVEFKNIQFIEGSIAPTGYTPYEEHSEDIGVELHGINGIHDEIVNNTVIFRNKETLLNGSETWEMTGYTTTNTNAFRINKDDIANINILCDKFIVEPNWTDFKNQDKECILFANSNNKLYIRINKNKATDLATFKTWLSTNNTKVVYNTKEEFYTVEVLEDFNNNLKAFKDGHMIVEYEGMCPEITATYAINIAAVRESMADMTKTNADQINNIWDALFLITKEIQALK